MKITRKEAIRQTFFGGLLAALGVGVAKKAVAATPTPIKLTDLQRMWKLMENTPQCGYVKSREPRGIAVERKLTLPFKPWYRLYYDVRLPTPVSSEGLSDFLFFWGHVNAAPFYHFAPGEILFEAFRAKAISRDVCKVECCFAALHERDRGRYCPADLNLLFEGRDVIWNAYWLPPKWPAEQEEG